MSDRTEHSKVKLGSEKSFGLVFAAAFTVIAFFPLLHGGHVRIWSIVVAAIFLAIALVYPRVLRPLNLLWFKFGILLGKVIAPIVISAVFFVIVTPMALIMRLMGKDPLSRKRNPGADTYWTARDKQADAAGSMKNQF